jgi:hypothetical protein
VYCCPNQYRRAISQLPEWIYYRTSDGVAVNLYAASSATLDVDTGKLSIVQETDYPNSGSVSLLINPDRAAEFSVSVRIPRWCTSPAVSVNGEVVGPVPRGTFFTLRRTWKPGDRIQLDLPMSWRFVKGRQAQAGKVALMRGPLVFGVSRSNCKDLKTPQADRPTGRFVSSAGWPASLGLLTVDPSSIQGPLADRAVRPDGMACRVQGWHAGSWYDGQKAHHVELHLTELPDPDIEGTYFTVPNPVANELVDDDLFIDTNPGHR